MIKTFSMYLLLLGMHIALVASNLLPGKLMAILAIDGFLAVLFIGGMLISLPGIKKGGENFSIRFLLVTTVQLLLMLGLILVLTFGKLGEGVKIMGFSAISIFVILLAIQSVVLVKKVNNLNH